MMGFAGINYLAIIVAAALGFAAGAVWYGVLGKQWMAALGLTKEQLGRSPTPFVIAAIAELVMAWVLAGVIAHLGPVTIRSGAISAFFIWLGFVATTLTVNYAYGQRKPALMVIDAGHWLAVLLVMGIVLGAFGV
jgi:Protein of unknown function (DUF1761)